MGTFHAAERLTAAILFGCAVFLPSESVDTRVRIIALGLLAFMISLQW